MKIVRVVYTTKAEYAAQNKANIQKVMSDLQALNNSGMLYNVCLSQDEKTFTHLAFFKTEKDEKQLLELPSFISFQQQLKASGPETPPKQDFPSLVGVSSPSFLN